MAHKQQEFTEQRGRMQYTEPKASSYFRTENPVDEERLAFLKWKYEEGNQGRATYPQALQKFKDQQEIVNNSEKAQTRVRFFNLTESDISKDAKRETSPLRQKK